jgi:hypothetical protein
MVRYDIAELEAEWRAERDLRRESVRQAETVLQAAIAPSAQIRHATDLARGRERLRRFEEETTPAPSGFANLIPHFIAAPSVFDIDAGKYIGG